MDSVTTKLTLPLWEEYYQYDKVNTRKYQNYKIIHSRLVENCIDRKSQLLIIYFVSNNSAIEKIYKTNFNLQKSRTYFNNMYHLQIMFLQMYNPTIIIYLSEGWLKYQAFTLLNFHPTRTISYKKDTQTNNKIVECFKCNNTNLYKCDKLHWLYTHL